MSDKSNIIRDCYPAGMPKVPPLTPIELCDKFREPTDTFVFPNQNIVVPPDTELPCIPDPACVPPTLIIDCATYDSGTKMIIGRVYDDHKVPVNQVCNCHVYEGGYYISKVAEDDPNRISDTEVWISTQLMIQEIKFHIEAYDSKDVLIQECDTILVIDGRQYENICNSSVSCRECNLPVELTYECTAYNGDPAFAVGKVVNVEGKLPPRVCGGSDLIDTGVYEIEWACDEPVIQGDYDIGTFDEAASPKHTNFNYLKVDISKTRNRYFFKVTAYADASKDPDSKICSAITESHLNGRIIPPSCSEDKTCCTVSIDLMDGEEDCEGGGTRYPVLVSAKDCGAGEIVANPTYILQRTCSPQCETIRVTQRIVIDDDTFQPPLEECWEDVPPPPGGAGPRVIERTIHVETLCTPERKGGTWTMSERKPREDFGESYIVFLQLVGDTPCGPVTITKDVFVPCNNVTAGFMQPPPGGACDDYVLFPYEYIGRTCSNDPVVACPEAVCVMEYDCNECSEEDDSIPKTCRARLVCTDPFGTVTYGAWSEPLTAGRCETVTQEVPRPVFATQTCLAEGTNLQMMVEGCCWEGIYPKDTWWIWKLLKDTLTNKFVPLAEDYTTGDPTAVIWWPEEEYEICDPETEECEWKTLDEFCNNALHTVPQNVRPSQRRPQPVRMPVNVPFSQSQCDMPAGTLVLVAPEFTENDPCNIKWNLIDGDVKCGGSGGGGGGGSGSCGEIVINCDLEGCTIVEPILGNFFLDSTVRQAIKSTTTLESYLFSPLVVDLNGNFVHGSLEPQASNYVQECLISRTDELRRYMATQRMGTLRCPGHTYEPIFATYRGGEEYNVRMSDFDGEIFDITNKRIRGEVISTNRYRPDDDDNEPINDPSTGKPIRVPLYLMKREPATYMDVIGRKGKDSTYPLEWRYVNGKRVNGGTQFSITDIPNTFKLYYDNSSTNIEQLPTEVGKSSIVTTNSPYHLLPLALGDFRYSGVGYYTDFTRKMVTWTEHVTSWDEVLIEDKVSLIYETIDWVRALFYSEAGAAIEYGTVFDSRAYGIGLLDIVPLSMVTALNTRPVLDSNVALRDSMVDSVAEMLISQSKALTTSGLSDRVALAEDADSFARAAMQPALSTLTRQWLYDVSYPMYCERLYAADGLMAQLLYTFKTILSQNIVGSVKYDKLFKMVANSLYREEADMPDAPEGIFIDWLRESYDEAFKKDSFYAYLRDEFPVKEGEELDLPNGYRTSLRQRILGLLFRNIFPQAIINELHDTYENNIQFGDIKYTGTLGRWRPTKDITQAIIPFFAPILTMPTWCLDPNDELLDPLRELYTEKRDEVVDILATAIKEGTTDSTQSAYDVAEVVFTEAKNKAIQVAEDQYLVDFDDPTITEEEAAEKRDTAIAAANQKFEDDCQWIANIQTEANQIADDIYSDTKKEDEFEQIKTDAVNALSEYCANKTVELLIWHDTKIQEANDEFDEAQAALELVRDNEIAAAEAQYQENIDGGMAEEEATEIRTAAIAEADEQYETNLEPVTKQRDDSIAEVEYLYEAMEPMPAAIESGSTAAAEAAVGESEGELANKLSEVSVAGGQLEQIMDETVATVVGNWVAAEKVGTSNSILLNIFPYTWNAGYIQSYAQELLQQNMAMMPGSLDEIFWEVWSSYFIRIIENSFRAALEEDMSFAPDTIDNESSVYTDIIQPITPNGWGLTEWRALAQHNYDLCVSTNMDYNEILPAGERVTACEKIMELRVPAFDAYGKLRRDREGYAVYELVQLRFYDATASQTITTPIEGSVLPVAYAHEKQTSSAANSGEVCRAYADIRGKDDDIYINNGTGNDDHVETFITSRSVDITFKIGQLGCNEFYTIHGALDNNDGLYAMYHMRNNYRVLNDLKQPHTRGMFYRKDDANRFAPSLFRVNTLPYGTGLGAVRVRGITYNQFDTCSPEFTHDQYLFDRMGIDDYDYLVAHPYGRWLYSVELLTDF